MPPQHGEEKHGTEATRAGVQDYPLYVEAVRAMRDGGVGDLISLPRIVVAGQQSTGKSSLLEILSGVEFPRASGTCTRQPTELRLQKSDPDAPFRGTLKVRWGGEKGAEDKERWENNSLGVLREYEGDFSNGECIPISSHGELSSILKDATARLMGENPEGFSDSVIVLEIKHSSVENLEVIDTPGIVETSFGQEEISWLKKLVSEYMAEENTIVLVAIECSGDLSNQKMLDLVKDADSTQERTKIVLTKADLIEEGDEERWVEIVRGQGEWIEYAKVHGCTVVRSRTPKELKDGISEQERLEIEKKFFKSSIWDDVDPTHIGTWSLKKEIDQLLGGLMKRCVPDLLKEVREQLELTKTELAPLNEAVPEDPTAQSQVLLRAMKSLSRRIDESFALQQRMGGCKNIFREIDDLNQAFCTAIKQTAPQDPKSMFEEEKFPAVEISEVKTKEANGVYVYKCHDEWNYPVYCHEEHPEFLICHDYIHIGYNPQLRWTVKNTSINTGVLLFSLSKATTPAQIEPNSWKEHNSWTDPNSWNEDDIQWTVKEKKLNFEENEYFNHVREMARDKRGRLLPDTIANAVRPNLINKVTEKWNDVVEKYIDEVYQLINKTVADAIRESVSRFPQLWRLTRRKLDELLSSQKQKVVFLTKKFQKMEAVSFTLNEHYLRDSKKKKLQDMYKMSDEYLLECLHAMKISGSLEEIKRRHPGIVELVKKQTPFENTDDNTEELMELIVSVHSYHKVASKRFVDYVVMAVDLELMRELSDLLDEEVIPEICYPDKKGLEEHQMDLEELLSENDDVVRRRKRLLGTQEKLELAKSKLQGLLA